MNINIYIYAQRRSISFPYTQSSKVSWPLYIHLHMYKRKRLVNKVNGPDVILPWVWFLIQRWSMMTCNPYCPAFSHVGYDGIWGVDV